jgi:precorrin-2 dehydrogenase
MFPIFLNLQDRLGVVIGGGPVGRRKADALHSAGARVRLVCLETAPPGFAGEWIKAAYAPAHLHGASLAFAAATPEVNRRVVADARARGLWVNSATGPENGDFFLPSVLRRDDLVLAVGTSGTAPALAGTIRRLLERQLDDAFGAWVRLLAELRPMIQNMAAGDRPACWECLCDARWLERLRLEPMAAVRAAMVNTLLERRPSAPGNLPAKSSENL